MLVNPISRDLYSFQGHFDQQKIAGLSTEKVRSKLNIPCRENQHQVLQILTLR